MYQLAFFVAAVAFGGWFLYDWKIGYPEKNRTEAITKLPAFAEDPSLKAEELYDKLDEKPNSSDFAKLEKSLAATDGTSKDLAQIEAIVGKPDLERRDADRRLFFYLSKTGGLKVEERNGVVQPITPAKSWKTWNKSHEEVENQKWWGLIPIVLSLLFLRKFLQAITLRARLEENEMVYGGTVIPYSQIESIQDYNPKGWVDVYYRDAANRRKKLRIDNQKIEKFEPLVDELCRIKGVPNPIAAARATESLPPEQPAA
jgi:hypothetical protein